MQTVEIQITLKKTISDPQGLTIRGALESLGFNDVKEVRIGKLISMKINSANAKEARQKIDKMCQKLLANPIIEDYSFRII